MAAGVVAPIAEIVTDGITSLCHAGLVVAPVDADGVDGQRGMQARRMTLLNVSPLRRAEIHSSEGRGERIS